jgi:hypothetical protein
MIVDKRLIDPNCLLTIQLTEIKASQTWTTTNDEAPIV